MYAIQSKKDTFSVYLFCSEANTVLRRCLSYEHNGYICIFQRSEKSICYARNSFKKHLKCKIIQKYLNVYLI